MREAIPKTGKLVLVELVVPPGYSPGFANLLDLEMMVICDGKERTEAEYRTLLAGAGFRLRASSQPKGRTAWWKLFQFDARRWNTYNPLRADAAARRR